MTTLDSARTVTFMRWAEMTDTERHRFLEWVRDTCLMFGTTRYTAWIVAASFAQGLDGEMEDVG